MADDVEKPMESSADDRMDRRKSILHMIKGALGALSGNALETKAGKHPQEDHKSAGDALPRFPDSIKEKNRIIARVEKMPVPGAAITLVHVKDLHRGMEMEEALKDPKARAMLEKGPEGRDALRWLDEHLAASGKMEEENERILRYCLQTFGTRTILMEGLHEGNRKKIEGYVQPLRRLRQEIAILEQREKSWTGHVRNHPEDKRGESELQKIRAHLKEARETFAEHAGVLEKSQGAAATLAIGGIADLVPIEERALHQRAVQSVKRYGMDDPRTRKIVFTEREEQMLETVGKRPETVQTLILGGSHDLRGSVEKYNATHPDRKIALMIITAKTYEDYDAQAKAKQTARSE